MTREQAKDLLPIIQAFAEGKIIQSRRINGMRIDLEMKTALNIISLIDEPQKYRIKPESKYRLFKNAEECWQEMLKHQPLGWIKASHGYFNIVGIMDDNINFGTKDNWLDYEYIFKMYKFIDGTPFGIKEE